MKPPPELHADPTFLKGPREHSSSPGKSKTLRFAIDAKDEFFASGRGASRSRCSHPDIDDEDIAVGSLHNGRVRAIIAVPAEAQLGEFTITAGVYGWARRAAASAPTSSGRRRWRSSTRSPRRNATSRQRRTRTGRRGAAGCAALAAR